MNIYQRINAVRKKVEYIKKDAAVQGYKAVSHDLVTAMVRDHLIEQGVLVVPSLAVDGGSDFAHSVTEGQTANNKFKLRYEAVYEVRFINVDDPQEVLSMFVPSHADDHGDKAPGKALSYAVKNALLKVFSIETGENDESRVENAPPYSEIQKAYFDDYVNNKNGIALYLFKNRVGDDVYTALFNSGDTGKKTKLKEACRELEAEGAKEFIQFVELVEAEESLGAIERVQELDDVVARMAIASLDPAGRQFINKALTDAA